MKPQPKALLGFPKDLRGKTTFDGLVFTKPNYEVTDENDVANKTYAETSLDTKVPNKSVTTAQIVDGAVTTAKLQQNGITGTNFASSSITTAKLVDGAVNGDKIAPGGVTTAKLATSAVSGAKFQPGIITSAYIGDGAVTSSFFSSGSITTSKLTDGAVRFGNIPTSAITAGKLAPNSISAALVDTNAIGTAAIQDGSIPSSSISNAGIFWSNVDFINLSTEEWRVIPSNSGSTFAQLLPSGDNFVIKHPITTDRRAKEIIIDNTASSTPSTSDNSIKFRGYVGSTLTDLVSFSARGKGTNLVINERNNSDFIFSETASGTDLFRIRFNGDVNNSTNTYGTISDARLKTEIRPAPSQTDEFMKLEFVNYKLKGKDDVYLGLIAQQVEEVCDGIVRDNGELKTVNLAAVGMKALGALQETMHRIDKLVESKRKTETHKPKFIPL